MTSSTIPTVKLWCSVPLNIKSKTALICFGWVSLLLNPYLPPMTLIFFLPIKFKALVTSSYNPSPTLPNSFVLSKTAISLTVLGRALTNNSAENGL